MAPPKRRLDSDRSNFAEKRFSEEFRTPWRRAMRGATFVVTGAMAFYLVFHADFNRPGSPIPEKNVFTDLRAWYRRKLDGIFPKPRSPQ
mmetsp:Transcript_19600/g.27603  ORF Transcript_19600/g.27603 Transcript_19600/m.27603 type:complete len:89 (+) Transcript_19600:76-342(+)